MNRIIPIPTDYFSAARRRKTTDCAGPLDVKRRQSSQFNNDRNCTSCSLSIASAQNQKPNRYSANRLRWSSSSAADLVGRKKSIEFRIRELDRLLRNPLMWGHRCYAKVIEELA